METIKRYSDEILEVHNEFGNSGNMLLAKALQTIQNKDAMLSLLEQEKQNIPEKDKAQSLVDLGFCQAKTCIEVNKKLNELDNKIIDLKYQAANDKIVADAILYFNQRYPLYKFITIEEVERLCQKYGLVYGGVWRYKGFVPQKNIDDIKNFKINNEDKASTLWSPNEEDVETWEKGQPNSIGLYIAAPISDMDMRNAQLNGFAIKSAVPDPVVLQPVVFETGIISYGENYLYKGFLIVTAWGDEASDELIVNPNHN